MTLRTDCTEKITEAVNDILSAGIIPDPDTISFIKSGYGLNSPDEITSFLSAGDESGAVIELVSYPTDPQREEIEMLIPAGGLSAEEIRNIEFNIISRCSGFFLNYNGKRIPLDFHDSKNLCRNYIKRLNMEIPVDYIQQLNTDSDNQKLLRVRTCLRKKRFIPGAENSLFMEELFTLYRTLPCRIHNEAWQLHSSTENPLPGKGCSSDDHNYRELLELVSISADLLNGSEDRPFDILAEKKYYYENAITETEEFSRLLRTYSMEFIMMKKIQPPLITEDEARSMIRIIDRLTSIVYGLVIPSVKNQIMDEF